MGAEVAKNLVLAGIKSLNVMDHENLTDSDFTANFLAPRDKKAKIKFDMEKTLKMKKED